MRISIHARLVFYFVGFTVCVLCLSMLLTRWSFVNAFSEYIDGLEQNRLGDVAERMASIYAAESAWPVNIEARFERASRQPPGHRPPPHVGRRRGAPKGKRGGPPRARTGPHPTALFDLEGWHIAGARLRGTDEDRASVPVLVEGRLVGHVQSVPRRISRPLEQAFFEQQSRTSIVIALVSVFLAVLFATFLARWMLTPVRRLLAAVSELSRGNYDVELREVRKDELGSLMADFASLAMTLRRTREARRRLFADVSHELRTPLAVLSAEMEALSDGVRPFDAESLASLDEEVARLRGLVDDLYDLSTSDLGALSYTLVPCDLREILEGTLRALPASELEMVSSLAPSAAAVDARRIEQLFRNLLLNAMAYTNVPGKIDVRLSSVDGFAEVVVRDTAPSVPKQECHLLFEPLYRVEGSRSRRTAGAGLGLAIARNIVEAHGGTIEAEPSALGGLKVTVRLPLLEAI